MMSKRTRLLPLLAIVLAIGFFTVVKPAHAFSFADIITGAKTFLLGGEKKELKVESKIELVDDGDLNKNGQIDAGDTIKYSFTITNTSDKTYSFGKLNTNVITTEINSLSNIKGVVSIDDSKKTIVIPNITVNPNQVRKISFEAKPNLYKDSDKTLSSEAEYVDEKNTPVFTSEKKEILVKKVDDETFNKLVHITK
jgi:hypothetical protein